MASIRHWYPEIPIVLVKDLIFRDFDTTEIEQHFNVSIYPQNARIYGWGFSKFEVFLEESKKRFLMLDSDIVLAGPILEMLEKYNEDWVVIDEPFTMETLYRWYFDPEKIKIHDPEFSFPNFTFNTGQLVGFTGILKRHDFDKFIEWSEPRVQLFREAFTFGGEQPLLNYVLMKKLSKKEITLHRLKFMVEGMSAESKGVLIERIKKREGYPFIIHWHDGKDGVMIPSMKNISRNDLLLFFEDLYYRKVGVSSFNQYLRIQYEYKLELLRVFMINTIRNNDKIRGILKGIVNKYDKLFRS